MDEQDVIEGLAIAHAQGFAAGQLDMQKRATSKAVEAILSDKNASQVAGAIRALPIKDQP